MELKTEVLTLNLLEYVKEKHEFTAFHKGEQIIVDPFTGCVWEDESTETKEVTFEGFWHTKNDNVFLPTKEMLNG